jgi:branched-chain amino acid transport system ATP-binding protein
MAAILEVDALHVAYGATRVLHGVGFTVEAGGITTILGANGAGKTTTLRAVSGMIAREGIVRFDGQRIEGRASEDITRLGIAHVPEGRGTFVGFTVEENLRLGAYVRRDRAAVGQDLERIYTHFPVLGARRRQAAGTLSGGEQQMLAIGRALMSRPRLLLLDEPSLGLAPLMVERIFATIAELKHQGRTILLVEQNVHQALDIADRAYVVETGRTTLDGPAADLRHDPKVEQSYLGVGGVVA